MAQPTIAEDIAKKEAQLAKIQTIISEQEGTNELEEGGAGDRFRMKNEDIDKLYKREEKLQTKLNVLYRSV